jgi:hypothetical protein
MFTLLWLGAPRYQVGLLAEVVLWSYLDPEAAKNFIHFPFT